MSTTQSCTSYAPHDWLPGICCPAEPLTAGAHDGAEDPAEAPDGAEDPAEALDAV